MSQAFQIVARGPRARAEAAAAAVDADLALEGVAYSILEEDEERGAWRIDAFPVTQAQADGLQTALNAAGGLTVTVEVLADADWLAMALSGLPPVRAGRFFIYGVHDRGRAPPNTVNLRIEAGAAFGTGHHGSTVGCLLAYHRLRKARQFLRVLDVGAGTGVLAIAALRSGARVAVGTDIDPVSVRICRENARINRVRARFAHTGGLTHPAVRAAAPYDLVFANILARPLARLSPAIAAAAGPGGAVILSGLLRSQERYVKAAYLARGFRLAFRLHRDAWSALALIKR